MELTLRAVFPHKVLGAPRFIFVNHAHEFKKQKMLVM